MGLGKVIQNLQSMITAPVVPEQNGSIYDYGFLQTRSGRRITPELTKSIATAYRCSNIISDDVASIPFQMFERINDQISRIYPDPVTKNIPYLIEVQPNRWMVPFIFRKTLKQWLMFYGDAYTWYPPMMNEIFILESDRVKSHFDEKGNLWWIYTPLNGNTRVIPDFEIKHEMINSVNGINGRSIISYARETILRQLAMHETQTSIATKGLNPAGIIKLIGELKQTEKETAADARKRIKTEFLDAISTTRDAGGVAIFDKTIESFTPITMKPVDAQFLETMQFTDVEIANFFSMPLWKVNQGKESYESNIAQQLDYLQTTLNPYLIQEEQESRRKWIPEKDQSSVYFRAVRESILRMDPKSRAEYIKVKIASGTLTPNEGRQIDDMSSYPEGNGYYFPSNMAKIGENGNLVSIAGNKKQGAKK